jgi:hypothetical protein
MNPTANNRQYYAIKPLAKTLLSNPAISVRNYIKDTGWGQQTAVSLQQVDIEEHAKLVLQAIDSITIQPLPVTDEDDPANAALIQLREAGNKLARAIADSVEPLFQYLPNAPLLHAARSAMEQLLQQRFITGYTADSIAASLITGEAAVYKNGQSLGDKEEEAIDPATLPVVLRSVPVVMMPVDQTATESYPATSSPGEMKQWNYSSNFVRSEHPNDILYISIAFADAGNTTAPVLYSANPLLLSITQFNVVFTELKNDLPPTGTALTALTNTQRIALNVFADGVEAVADAWANYWNDPIAAPEPQDITNAWQLQAYTGEAGSGLLLQPLSTAAPYTNQPDLFIANSNEPLAKTMLNENEYLYSCDPLTATSLRLELNNLDIFTTDGACTGIAAQRNLFSDSTLAVDPAFVFPATAFTWSPVIYPLPEYTAPFILEGNSAALPAFFATLLSDAKEVIVTIQLTYQYEIAPGLPAILPVLLLPATPWKPEIIDTILQAVAQWQQQQQPATGNFVMDTTVENADGRVLIKVGALGFRL